MTTTQVYRVGARAARGGRGTSHLQARLVGATIHGGPDAPRRQEEYVAQLTELLTEGHRGEAMALFLRTVGLLSQ
jgi:hypothetical protein